MKQLKLKRVLSALILLVIFSVTAGCGQQQEQGQEEVSTSGGMMAGMGGGMMARHQAQIPSEYRDLQNPLTADEEALQRAADVYTTNCATCHGDGGMGDGPAAESLDPAPVAIAHTGQMLGDDYLFWRISEGGNMEPFNSAMPGWKASLDENARWELISYIRALGAGTVSPGQMMGGERMDPALEATRQAEMLDQAVANGVLSSEEASLFTTVHALLEEKIAASTEGMVGNMAQRRQETLDQMVADGDLSAADAQSFNDIHDRLIDAGLME